MSKLLITTPISHIEGLVKYLKKDFELIMLETCEKENLNYSEEIDAIFTNPNQLTFNIDKFIFDLFPNLSVVCTASTGTNHIDKEESKLRGIKIISITEERDTINKISSTAEHALALTLSALRNIPSSFDSVKKNNWSYLPFIGRQLSELKVGIIGYGRLGKFYANYCDAFGSEIFVYDPYKDVVHPRIKRVKTLQEIAYNSDIISIHAHVNKETIHLIDNDFLKKCKSDVLIVNTSRGEIVDEKSLQNKLIQNPKMKYATDVLEGEFTNHDSSSIINFSKNNNQVLITSHIAGMTTEAQSIAYFRAAELLKNHMNLL